jgi:glycosyltransferase involved in cell wall biosynthesis
MRVVHVDTAATWRGGQNQVLLTARGQAARGHDVVVACRRGGALEARAREASLAVRPLPFRGDLWPPAVLGLARALRESRPDVVQLHDPHAVGAGVAAARLAGSVKTVATRRVDFRLRGLLSRWKYARCRRVIAVSRAIASVMQADGFPAERVSLVYEGVPDREPAAGGAEVLRSLGIPDGAPVVGNVAALTGHKDHATLVDAAQVVLRRRSDVRFVVVGEGPLRRELEARVGEQGLAGRVVFAGFRSDVDRLLPAFSVFCLSSHLEGLGTSLLDAMAFGLPVVATAAGGIPEAVEHGVTGLVVPVRRPDALAQALLEVLEDGDLRRRLGAAGRARFLERFTADRMVEETLRVYQATP